MRSFRLTVLPLVLIALLGFLQYRLWFEAGGIIDMLRIKKELALQLSQNDKIKLRNEKLVHQLQYLQASNAGIETRARGELGMVKKGETFYQIVKEGHNPN
jgi:cell division protein FtsB